MTLTDEYQRWIDALLRRPPEPPAPCRIPDPATRTGGQPCACHDPAVWGHVTPCRDAIPAQEPGIGWLRIWHPIGGIDTGGRPGTQAAFAAASGARRNALGGAGR